MIKVQRQSEFECFLNCLKKKRRNKNTVDFKESGLMIHGCRNKTAYNVAFPSVLHFQYISLLLLCLLFLVFPSVDMKVPPVQQVYLVLTSVFFELAANQSDDPPKIHLEVFQLGVSDVSVLTADDGTSSLFDTV